jgi:hypothetical protein
MKTSNYKVDMWEIMPEDNLLKCNICGTYLSIEDVDLHKCDIPFKGVKSIPIAFFFKKEIDSTNVIIVAKGLDGVLYKLILSNKKDFTPYPTDFDSKNNRRRLDRTQP